MERAPPSIWAVAFATTVIAGLAGYFLGQASSIGIFSSPRSDVAAAPSEKRNGAADSDISDAGDESDSDDHDDQELNGFDDSAEECKLVLVVRTDLGMTKGM